MKLYLFAPLFIAAIPIPCQAEWQAAAYLGGAHTQNAGVHIRQQALGTDLLFRDVSYRGESFESPQYYGLRTGNFFTEHLGLEVEFIHLKVFANLGRSVPTSGTVAGVPTSGSFPMSTFVQRFSVSHGMNMLLVNFVARKQFFRAPQERLGRLLINGRAGVGGTIPHTETEIMGLRDEHYQWGGVALQFAGGAEVRLCPNCMAWGSTSTLIAISVFESPAGIPRLCRAHITASSGLQFISNCTVFSQGFLGLGRV